MKKIYIIGLALCLLIPFTNVSFAQTLHSVLVGPGGQLVFEPANLTINTGDTVIWEWQSDNHSTTSDATSGAEVWDSGIHNTGATFSKVFTTLGMYPYHCTPHQAFGMVATITVQDVTGIENHAGAIIDKFTLNQNYPNPFNPSTKISYSISKSDFVTLKIYDILGKEIQNLVSEFQNTDTYSVSFNASELATGIYLYTLQVGNAMETKKMLYMQ